MAERLPNISIQQTNPSVVSLEKGKIPPQAIDLEAVVLGAMLIDKKELMKSLTSYIKMFFMWRRINIFLKLFFSCFKRLSPLIY